MPTFVFYFNGKAIDRISGSNPIILKRKSKYLSMLNHSETRLNNDDNKLDYTINKNVDDYEEFRSAINKSISELSIATTNFDKKLRKCKKSLLKSKSDISLKIDNYHEISKIKDYSKKTLNLKAIVMWTAKWYLNIYIFYN